jgi:hypothetical protein
MFHVMVFYFHFSWLDWAIGDHWNNVVNCYVGVPKKNRTNIL